MEQSQVVDFLNMPHLLGMHVHVFKNVPVKARFVGPPFHATNLN